MLSYLQQKNSWFFYNCGVIATSFAVTLNGRPISGRNATNTWKVGNLILLRSSPYAHISIARFPDSSIPPKLAPGKQAPARAFEVAKWLGKVIFISVEYSQIIRAAHSPTISNALFGFNHSPPRVIPVTHPGKEEREVTVSKSALKHIIEVALQDDVTQRQKDVPQGEDEEDGFISNIINRFKKLAFTSVEGAS